VKSTVRTSLTRLAAAGAIAGASVMTVGAPANAQAAAGKVTFYSQADFTGTTRSISYTACDGAVTLLASPPLSFDNQPLPGCKVQLLTTASRIWGTLCVGRGVVPQILRALPEVRAVPGSAPSCLLTSGQSAAR